MTLDRTKYLAYMRERWIEPDAIMIAIVQNSPVLGMLEREQEKMGGRYMHLPLLRVGAQGRSADHAKAKTNAKGSTTVGFDVQYVSNYQVAKLDGNTVDDAGGNENAIADAVDNELEATLANMRKDLQLGAFGNAGGSRGRIGSIGAGNAGANCRITLKNVTDSKFFEEGMVLQASANDGTATGHSLRASGATITITGIDKMKGYLEFASDVTASITGLTADDYLFADGDFKAKWSGFRGWIPTADPTVGDSFHGVDRTVSVQILSGLRYDATGKPIEQAIVDAMGYADLFDCHPDHVVVNPVRWAKFANSLGADRANRITRLTGNAGKAVVSYEAIMVSTNFGLVPVLADGGCGADEGLALTMSTWKIGYVGDDLVHVIDDDNLMIRRASSGDAWEIEVKHRGNLGCKQPGRNMRLTFSSF
jgi:hypothetical protein